MPKIVDKAKKRKDIAISCAKLLTQENFSRLTVSKIAINAKVAKGTIYDYFDTKEDIIFAVVECAQKDYDKEIKEQIDSTDNITTKILHLFGMCILNDNQTIKRRKIYKEFALVCLNEPSGQMISFQNTIKTKYIKWLKEIIQEGIDKKILKPQAIEFAHGLFMAGEAMVLFSQSEDIFDKNIMSKYIEAFVDITKIGE